jgi:hypothetical protein
VQKPERALPAFLNMDSAFERLDPNESPFLKNIESGINANPAIGSNNPTGEGQNAIDLTPTRSNTLVPGNLLPSGYNKCAGSFESEVTRETYTFYYNEPGQHSIWVLSGDTGLWSKVVQDPNLPIVADQKAFIAHHRVKIRVIYDENRNIVEKFLVYTNGAGWQGWINVIAAIATNGFDATLFPYFTLFQPHFDRNELLEWPVRPPMYNPVVIALANTAADATKVNRTIDQAFQFCYKFNLTDGRYSTASPYSLPYINKSEQFLSDPDLLPKNAQITLYAGSCMVESIDIYVRFTAKQQAGIPSTATWGDWMKYDRIYKFTGATGNPSDVISTEYWTRTNPWAKYSYDPIQNTIQYIFDNSRLPELVDQNAINRLQNDIPIRSIAMADLNNQVALLDNLVGYDNLPFSTIDNIDVEVEEKTNLVCPLPTRKIRLYAYVGRPSDNNTFESQVGYFVGTDTQMRWGAVSVGPQTLIQFDESQSKSFGLDFADHSAFVCYAKGTPYYSVGNWYTVNFNNVITKLDNLLDFSNSDVLSFCQTVFSQQGYFMCVFDFEVPAGRYDFAIGRHNVNLSGNFRGLSTYVYGIANSRIKSQTPVNYPAGFVTAIKPNAIVDTSKEMEIDCTAGDVDVWGNGHDLFYIFCPYPKIKGKNSWRFIEGYFKESGSNPIGVELVPYTVNVGATNEGTVTDKNGFYWAYTPSDIADTANIEVTAKFNCTYPFKFEIPSGIPGSIGWFQEGNSYLSDHNGGVVGDCNRILVKGKITDVTGTIPYANIAVSIKDGATTLTQQDGTFILIVHNGQPTSRTSNIYVNASGNFLITLSDCGYLPVFNFDESLAPCTVCNVRNYPFPINLQILIQGGTQESLKDKGTYNIGVAVADLAGRLGFVNLVNVKTVPSFVQRQNILATFFRMFFNGPMSFQKDFKWFAPYVTNLVNVQRYFQWVGDSIQYIDNAGNVVDDPSSAVFCSIAIDSFYNYALAKNFSILATYQFSPDDRIRILDDGNGNLLPAGQELDLQVLGTNYNQAAMTANIVPPNTNTPIINNTINNTVNNTVNTGTSTPTSTTTAATQKNNISITLYVKYDSRLNVLKDQNGFWIEISTPVQQAQEVQYNELTWYPIVNSRVAIFKDIVAGTPVFDYPASIDLTFWDTYLFFRNITIPNVGDKYLNHPFESPNISDSFGANVSSGGRKWEKNDDAAQQWLPADVIPSDDFIGNGIVNGLGTFRSERRKGFDLYPVGPIQAAHTERSIILFICENDWFMTSFDFHFTFPNAEGVMVTNLDGEMSKPAQKIGSNFGMAPEDTGTFVVYEHDAYWYDKNNAAWVRCDYKNAVDVSDLEAESDSGTPKKLGVKSYFTKKSKFIGNWNNSHSDRDKFDVIAGIDTIRQNIFITFRPRRNNSNDVRSYINRRRAMAVSEQETIIYNINTRRWTRFVGFTPEAYAEVKGTSTGVEFMSFAAGKGYFHNVESKLFLNFYGMQTEPVIVAMFNKPPDMNKVGVAFSYDTNDARLAFYADLIYTSLYNSFSYIPVNYLKLKSGEIYSQVLRDMNSYPPTLPQYQYLNMLQDGKRIYDVFMLVRMVGNPQQLERYFQLNNVYTVLTEDKPTRK